MTHAQQYYENYGSESVAEYVEHHLRRAPAESERIARLAALLDAGAESVLDVGAGHGLLLEALAERRGMRGIGIEITEAKVQYARSRDIDLRLGEASRLEFADRTFDTVYCCEVLEHLPYGTFESACAELTRVARTQIVVSVPYDERRHFVRCPYCGASANPNYHFRSFDGDSMALLLPGWRLDSSFELGREPHGWLKHWARPYLARNWPAPLVCPSCGWRPSSQQAASSNARRGWWRYLARVLPTPTRPTWRIGIYRRA